ncbi:MAG: transposase [Candidatus Binatia bacterium]
MPRIPLGQQAGFVYHVINRGNGRATIFHKAQDYQAFLSILALAKARHPVKLFAFSLMPNHFHFVIEASHHQSLSQFMQWLLTSHGTALSQTLREQWACLAGPFQKFSGAARRTFADGASLRSAKSGAIGPGSLRVCEKITSQANAPMRLSCHESAIVFFPIAAREQLGCLPGANPSCRATGLDGAA